MDDISQDWVERVFDGLRLLKERPALSTSTCVWTGNEILALISAAKSTLEARGLCRGCTVSWAAGEDPLAVPVRLAAMAIGATFHHGPAADGVRLTQAELPIIAPSWTAPARQAVTSPARETMSSLSTIAFETLLPGLRDAVQPTAGMAIFEPLAGLGGDATLLSFAASAAVHWAPSTSAARALTFIERVRAGGAFISATMLGRMLEHPAVSLVDLECLRVLIYHSGTDEPLAAAQTHRAAQLLGSNLIACTTTLRAPRPHPAQSRKPRSDAERLSRLTKALAQEFDDSRLHRAIAPLDRLATFSLKSMLSGLRLAGAFSSLNEPSSEEEVLEAAGVAPEHRPLIRRWLRVLTEQEVLKSDGTALRVGRPEYTVPVTRQAWDALQRSWHGVTGATGTIEYARRNAERLPELISGRVQAVHVLFPEGRTDLARALYRESIAARYQHRAVALFVSHLARAWSEERPMRVLEVGGGTAATTETIFQALPDHSIDYLFTDVSRYFLDTARPALEALPGVHFGIYDIDRTPVEQGYSADAFDVVISGGALNAAKNTDRSLAGLHSLLKPGGWLVITEPTQEEFWVLASQAFMLATLDDPTRASSNSTFLSWSQWCTALERASFARVVDLPPAEHPLLRLGHRIFACRAERHRNHGARHD